MSHLLKAEHISKSFGALDVVQDVSMHVDAGEVVGLAGQSGSGKSILAMLLAGFHAPDKGSIYFNDNQLVWPFHIRSLGIEIILQTPNLAENLDITANIFLGNEIGWPLLGKWLKIPHQSRMDREAARILDELGMQFSSLRLSVSNLTSEERQMIAIARVMTREPDLIIIDDPARLLGYENQQILLSLIQKWRKQGVAVLFSSNNLDHLQAVTDRIIVLKKAKKIGEYRTDDVSRDEILAKMTGISDQQQLTPIIWALDSYYRAREQSEKIQQNKALVEKNLGGQEKIKRKLIDQLSEQVNVLDSANLSLQDAQRRLLAELEEERKHLAREIHDQIIQDLLSTNYQLEEIEAESDATAMLKDNLSEVRANIRGLIEDLRIICGNLRPPTIDSLGVGAAIQSLARNWERRTSIPVQLEIDERLDRLPEIIELSIFRIVQEGLNNIHKHAGAKNVQVSVMHNSPRSLILTISDNGQGIPDDFDLSKLLAQGHYGLLGISERVVLLGGRLRLQNQETGMRGLLMQVEIPHPRVETVSGVSS